MSIAKKIFITILIVVIGTIISGVVGDLIGVGQYITTGVMVVIIFLVWSRPHPKNKITKGESDV